MEETRCLDDRGDGSCQGPVEWHSTDPGLRPAFPRCDRHWELRLDRREHSMEKYADSDAAPGWFDLLFAGERWDEE